MPILNGAMISKMITQISNESLSYLNLVSSDSSHILEKIFVSQRIYPLSVSISILLRRILSKIYLTDKNYNIDLVLSDIFNKSTIYIVILSYEPYTNKNVLYTSKGTHLNHYRKN